MVTLYLTSKETNGLLLMRGEEEEMGAEEEEMGGMVGGGEMIGRIGIILIISRNR
jgi:hypothetical protein